MGKNFTSLAFLFGRQLVLDGRVWGIGRVLRAALGGQLGRFLQQISPLSPTGLTKLDQRNEHHG